MEDLMKREAANQDRLLRRSEAAKYVTDKYGIPCSPKTLAKLACVSSEGPPFRFAGRFPLYPVSGLDAWAQSKIGPLVGLRVASPNPPASDENPAARLPGRKHRAHRA